MCVNIQERNSLNFKNGRYGTLNKTFETTSVHRTFTVLQWKTFPERVRFQKQHVSKVCLEQHFTLGTYIHSKKLRYAEIVGLHS